MKQNKTMIRKKICFYEKLLLWRVGHMVISRAEIFSQSAADLDSKSNLVPETTIIIENLINNHSVPRGDNRNKNEKKHTSLYDQYK